MPAQQDETINIVKITKLALDIFNEDYIFFNSENEVITIKFDRTQLIRVITNLIKNSIQAISESQPENPNIKVNVYKENYFALISVMDNGIGIKDENKALVFEPKFTTKTSGMGLGLAMVKKIVETYGGDINFTENINEGVTFTVKIPLE
jgi:signal transduction histidine kinase